MDHVGWSDATVAAVRWAGAWRKALAASIPTRPALTLIDTTAWYAPDAPKHFANAPLRPIEQPATVASLHPT